MFLLLLGRVRPGAGFFGPYCLDGLVFVAWAWGCNWEGYRGPMEFRLTEYGCSAPARLSSIDLLGRGMTSRHYTVLHCRRVTGFAGNGSCAAYSVTGRVLTRRRSRRRSLRSCLGSVTGVGRSFLGGWMMISLEIKEKDCSMGKVIPLFSVDGASRCG